MQENEVPLIVIQLKVHWVVWIHNCGWGSSLSHDEEFRFLTLPWGSLIDFLLFWLDFDLDWASLSLLLFLWLGIVIKIIKVWELLFRVYDDSFWDEFFRLYIFHFEA